LLEAGHVDGIYLIGAGPRANQGPKDSVAAVERLQGIKDALQAAGVEISGAVACSDWQPELGYKATQQLLERDMPSGLICFNDRLAFGAYQALADAGLAVPDDVSVVSFDDDTLASWVRPQLTTVGLPHYELGRTAIEVLLDTSRQRTADGRARIHRVPMPLRKRESVRHLAHAGE
jgi:LacI family transcriptional regulator